MLTITDKGGRVFKQILTIADKGGRGFRQMLTITYKYHVPRGNPYH